MDSENAQSYHQVKTRRFELDNKHKCQIKRNHSSTHVSLAASAILFRKLCRLFQISSGRDSRASKSGRRPIERTGIVLPIPAALPLAQTNRLLFFTFRVDWMMGYQGMVCLAGNQVWWTWEVEDIFNKVKKGQKTALKDYAKKLHGQIDELVMKVIFQVHFKDIRNCAQLYFVM